MLFLEFVLFLINQTCEFEQSGQHPTLCGITTKIILGAEMNVSFSGIIVVL